MRTSDPLHIAFVWHMHQPYYRLGPGAPFEMPWVRMHALKDYLDMVDLLTDYPGIHQTFNLVPSLIEQLETYAEGGFADIYWEHTLKPAAELAPPERAFVVERMCESPDHPRARSHPRYLELARRRAAQASLGWDACAASFTTQEIRDLQVWFNLAWFDPQTLERSPLAGLVEKGAGFSEEDKAIIADLQQDILSQTLPAYRGASARGRIELSTSPYYHPILPLLANTDSARIAAADTLLPPSRFAHPEDALEQLALAVDLHERTFGLPPRGVWCSEQAVGEDVLPLLMSHRFRWTISDETVLARSLSSVADSTGYSRGPRTVGAGPSPSLDPRTLYRPYLLQREGNAIAMVFRDHTLSDLIGFAYKSWNSRDAASDLLRRLLEIRASLVSSRTSDGHGASIPLVTIALDGENAWEYYPRDGQDFLRYLYEGLSADPRLRCVTISEHLDESPATRPLDWLHTGSWIGGDLRTWIGDSAHNRAWGLLHRTRDAVARARTSALADHPLPAPDRAGVDFDSSWRHVLAAEGSDWFWWFGDHHHTELDAVWDRAFRLHLQKAHELAGIPAPVELFYPLLEAQHHRAAALPGGSVSPVIDGMISTGSDGSGDEWLGSGYLVPAPTLTMERAERTRLREVRYGWRGSDLCVLIVPESPSSLVGLEIQVEITRPLEDRGLVFSSVLEEPGVVRTECKLCPGNVPGAIGAWKDVVELSLPVAEAGGRGAAGEGGLVVRVGRHGMTEHVFHSTGIGVTGREAI